MNQRWKEVKRTTLETEIVLRLDLQGTGRTTITTGIGFLDHLITTLGRHACFDLELTCRGDLSVDDHHTAEDCGLVLGTALAGILDEGRGIARFGWAVAPLDEALARSAVDLSGRPYAVIELGLARDSIGGLACENIGHFLFSFAMAARCCLHVEVLCGQNDHHKAEAAFKSVALSLRQAVRLTPGDKEIPSTKGVL